MKEDNPFSPVYDPRHFCDRKEEVRQLQINFFNGLNTVIHSPRRLGKTALIRHLFHQLEAENAADTIYVDLFATGKMQDLISLLAEKVLQKYHRKNLLQGIQQLLRGLNPTVSFAPDGTPSFSLQLSDAQHEMSLRQIFEYLENRKRRVFIAFDEFQEIGTYAEKAEALLRTHIQELRNVGFIFSGSTGHMIHEMFLGPKRPFYQQAEVLVLGKINRETYRDFIIDTFKEHKKKIEAEAVEYILDFSQVYTYYTQLMCNICFSQANSLLTVERAKSISQTYLESRKFDYLNILNLLTENQKKLVIAVAKEGLVNKPNSMEFLSKHKLPGASSVNQAMKILLDREILFQSPEGYMVYDVFFMRFINKYY